jgi:hypothetical protein
MEHDLFGKPVSTFPDHALGHSICEYSIYMPTIASGHKRLSRKPDLRRESIGLSYCKGSADAMQLPHCRARHSMTSWKSWPEGLRAAS